MIEMPQIDHDLLDELEDDYSPSAAAEANKVTLVAAILERVGVDYDEAELEDTDRVKSRTLRDILHEVSSEEKRPDGGRDEPVRPGSAPENNGRRRR